MEAKSSSPPLALSGRDGYRNLSSAPLYGADKPDALAAVVTSRPVKEDRFLSLPFLIASWVFFFKFAGSDLRPSLMTWAVWLALSFSPIDILPIPKGGPRRLVPLVMGLPRPQTVQRKTRGSDIGWL